MPRNVRILLVFVIKVHHDWSPLFGLDAVERQNTAPRKAKLIIMIQVRGF